MANESEFDPFLRLRNNETLRGLQGSPLSREGFEPLGSQKHIDILEAKLARLKKKQKEPNAKTMLDELCKTSEGQMRHLVNDSVSPYINNLGEYEDNPPDGTMAQLQRRLHPERQAVTLDELRHLVENDELAKQVAENVANGDDSSKTSSSSSKDIEHKPKIPNQEGGKSEASSSSQQTIPAESSTQSSEASTVSPWPQTDPIQDIPQSFESNFEPENVPEST